MHSLPPCPSLYEVNTRVTLNEIRPGATLDELPDAWLDRLAAAGFDIVWMLGVWQTGPMARAVSRSQAAWRQEFLLELPDLREDDICGSPFAIAAYTVHHDFGGDAALARLRDRLHRRGLRLLLDFVPNHTGLDHAWARAHLEHYIVGTDADLAHDPSNWRRMETDRGPAVLAYGKDPYFSGWPDTLQLNYRHPKFRAAMIAELVAVAGRCDGVRGDMAMLMEPDVFERTWGDRALPADGSSPADGPFWPTAIRRVRQEHPDFLFLAEVYWDREWSLIQRGFDFAYDKRLYDRLHGGDTAGVRAHLEGSSLDYHLHLARFMENHDEPRAAAAFGPAQHRAAAVITFLTPGMRFFHDGQFEGRHVRVSMHLGRRLAESVDDDTKAFYDRLLDCLRLPTLRSGRWRPMRCGQAWDGNPTWASFLAWMWEGTDGPPLLAAVNYGPTQGQCFVAVEQPDLAGHSVVLADLLGERHYLRDGDELLRRGLYLDIPAWGHHLFELRR